MNKYHRQTLFGMTPTANTGETTMADAVTATPDVKVGLVTKKGKTRGKNPRDIEYQAFDTSVPQSLPKTLAQFMELAGVPQTKEGQEEILNYVIDGFNAAQYSAASDEIGEFIPDTWSKEVANQFRLAVRNTSKLTGMDIEEVANMLKPKIEVALAKAKAAEAEAAANAKPEPVTA